MLIIGMVKMCCETAIDRSVCTELANISVRFFKSIKL